jgi:hypothetical protein
MVCVGMTNGSTPEWKHTQQGEDVALRLPNLPRVCVCLHAGECGV